VEVPVPVPLLQTKLHVPKLRRTVVPRPRLSSRLSSSWEATLTLVSAPAGFGKTTLLTEWSSVSTREGRATAWLSLDQRDNDPATFCRG
jgi:LuxR family maltose regulon positive regulatory protein